jgi:thiol-disulfide isomerase/thioredoxin
MDQSFIIVLLLVLLILWVGTRNESLMPGDFLWPHLTFNRGEDLRIVLFKSTSCEVCRRLAKKEWPQLRAKFPNTKFEEIDCDSNKDLCMQYGIGSFPTILMIKNGVPIPYKGSWRYEEMVVSFQQLGA